MTGVDDLCCPSSQVNPEQLSGDVLTAVEMLGEAGACEARLRGQVCADASAITKRTD